MPIQTEQELQDVINWIRTRPKSLHEAMIAFPLNCHVKAKIDLRVPGPGKIGEIVSYVEKKHGQPTTVRVRELPDGDIGAECQLDWIEPVEYIDNITPEFMKMALGRE
jgi:hypothetical protein